MEQKIPDEQRKELAERYFNERRTIQELADEYGVCYSTAWRIIHNSGIMDDQERKADMRTRIAMVKLKTASTDAVEKLLLMLEKERDVNHEYIDIQLIQQVLDRAGVRVEKNEKQDVKVHFAAGSGFTPSMPKRADGDSE